jgi:hypothetical protein
MKSIIALVFIATFSLATPVAAFDERGGWTPYGARSCGAWLEDRQEGGWADVGLTNWLSGFISGANRYRPGKSDYLESTDVKSAMLWIDKYCTKNPLRNAAEAAKALIEELAGRS